MKGPHLKLSQMVDAHSRAECTTLLLNPYKPSQIISIGFDSFLRVWNTDNLMLTHTLRIMSPYLTSIVAFDGHFVLGIGNGNLVQLSERFEIEKQYPDHQDCVTSIIVLPEYIVTASYDGDMHLLNKETFVVEKQLHFGMPIRQCLQHEGSLYVACTPCYRINLQTLEKSKLAGQYNQFIVHENKVFGCSDETGITCLDDNISMWVPCEYMLSVGNVIAFYAHGGVGTVSYRPEEENKWQLETVDGLAPGCSVLSAVYQGGWVYATGESGNIYKFEVRDQEKQEYTKEKQEQEQGQIVIAQT